MLSKKLAIVKLLEEVKSHSSKWMKSKGETLRKFYWQDGYGAFSVNPTEAEAVIKYIRIQKEHHARRTFQEEYRAFLNKYHVEYDERYEDSRKPFSENALIAGNDFLNMPKLGLKRD